MNNLKPDDLYSMYEAIKDTTEFSCQEAGMESNMRVYTRNNGMYTVVASKLLSAVNECKGLRGTIKLITGIDPEGRDYPVVIPFLDIRLILDCNDLIVYETDDDYIERAMMRSDKVV